MLNTYVTHLIPNPHVFRIVFGIILTILTLAAQAKEVTHTFKGLTINANLEMADGKDFQDGMVLIIHGYGGHNKMEIIRAIQQSLLDNEQSSLAINLSLGVDNRHGFLDCQAPHRHLQENAVLEIGTGVGWLRDRGVKKMALLGHSRGANQAMVYAVENLDPEVKHVVMLAPGAGEYIEVMYQERYGKPLQQVLEHAEKMVMSGQGEELIKNIDLLICPQTQATANTFVSYYGRENKFRQFKTYLTKVTVPTFIISGTEDDRQPEIVKIISPYVDEKLVHLHVVDGAGHFFRDLNMDEAIEASVDFITLLD